MHGTSVERASKLPRRPSGDASKRDPGAQEQRDREAIAAFITVYRRAIEELEKH